MPRATNIQIRRGSSTEWANENPVLNSGEPGYDSTKSALKIGDSANEWSKLPSVVLSANPDLASGSAQYNVISLRSQIVDFKSVGDTTIFTVPEGHMFFIDKMEVVTTSISSPNSAPHIRFGKYDSLSEFYASSQVSSNALGERHIIEHPQNGITAGSAITFGVTVASTAGSHYGCGIIVGFLLMVETTNSSSSSSSSGVYGANYFRSGSKKLDLSW
jgi:hypothetical protein